MKRLLTLDPGNGCTGAALFEGGELRAAWALAPNVDPGPCPTCPSCRISPTCQHQAHRPGLIIGQIIASVPELRQVDVCAIERPAYWKDTPDMPGLLRLADLAGALQGAVLAAGVPLVLAYEPRAWKGMVAKDVHQREALAALTEAERRRLPRRPQTRRFQPDALDAAGLGLFILGRNGRFLADPASFAELVEPAPARGASKGRRKRGPVQGGLALFAHATGPGGTPAALHADDVDGLLPGEVP